MSSSPRDLRDTVLVPEQLGGLPIINRTIETNTLETIRQEKRGRPGKHTRYRKITRDTFIIRRRLNDDTITRDAASDGCWPLITNDRTLTGAEVLAAYK